ncbi:hypothetical protein HDU76_004770 [Blyttiomyces sp. JEL0837]|nr:hypothetical protein HDU76_004770 [Blyttiomyces sp. JEL0837]
MGIIKTSIVTMPDCAKLEGRGSAPSSVHDLRADDIQIIMGIGDSVMAGMNSRTILAQQIANRFLNEDRGVNFATGGDNDSISVGAMFRQFNPYMKGLSYGTRDFEYCYGDLCPSRSFIMPDNVAVQGLNAAESGAWVLNWQNQVNYIKQYLPSFTQSLDSSKPIYKLLIIQLGFNDLCQSCDESPTATSQHNLTRIENEMKLMLNSLKSFLEDTIVVIMPPFKLSTVRKLQKSIPFCEKVITRMFPECTCMLDSKDENGVSVDADKGRNVMDKVSVEFTALYKKIVDEFNKKSSSGGVKNDRFWVVFDSGVAALDMSLGDMSWLSAADCFHPSVIGQNIFGANLW